MKKYLAIFAVVLAFGLANAQDATTSPDNTMSSDTNATTTTPPAAKHKGHHVCKDEAKDKCGTDKACLKKEIAACKAAHKKSSKTAS